MRHVTSLVRLNILEFIPLCQVCGIYDGHDYLECFGCTKRLCKQFGMIFFNNKTGNPTCQKCRRESLKRENSTFTLVIKFN